jgi:hypothetical protein
MNSRALKIESSLESWPAWRSKISPSSICLLVFCLAFLSYVYTTRGVLDWMGIPSGAETLHVARSLVTSGRFAHAGRSPVAGPLTLVEFVV